MSNSFSKCTVTVMLAAALLASASAARGQTTWYVDDDADPGGGGTSWTSPFDDLQDALNAAATNDVIHVAGGTYVPSVPSDPNDARTATFALSGGVELYGGYAGLADPNNPDQRDVDSYQTILTGDLAGNDDPNFVNNDENSYHVVYADGADVTGRLDGVTITAGNANAAEYPHRDGGGMIVDNGATPTIANCTFLENTAYMGGGLFNYSTDPTVTSCAFQGNTAEWGGGVNNSTSSATFTDCTFTGNSATGDGGGLRNIIDASPTLVGCVFTDNHSDLSGGGMISRETCSPTLSGCTFTGNTAVGNGGGMGNYAGSNPTLSDCDFTGNSTDAAGGGMVNDTSSSPTLSQCAFTGNSAGTAGGGMASYDSSSPTVVNCVFSNNTADGAGGGVLNHDNSNGAFTNCLFTGNAAVSYTGGGMINRAGSTPTLANCTFSGNSATAGGGISNKDSVSTVSNCILWDDTPDEIHIVSGSSPVVTYSDVLGGWTGTGNIDADPLFPGAGDYRLSSGSPCIDAADNFAVPADVTDLDNDADVAERTPLDLDLNPRFVNDEDTGDTGVPDPPNYPEVVDMGAYEFGAFCYGDLTGDGFINLSDLAQLLGHYGETGASYEDGDLDGDGDVDLSDLAELLGLYNTPC